MRAASLAAAGVLLLLSGCPGWSRPDPRLARGREPTHEPAPAATAPSAPAAPTPTAPAPGATLAPAPAGPDLAALRAGLARARGLLAAKQPREALGEISGLEDAGNDLLLRTPDEAEAAEVESLLLDVATLRDEVVRGEAR